MIVVEPLGHHLDQDPSRMLREMLESKKFCPGRWIRQHYRFQIRSKSKCLDSAHQEMLNSRLHGSRRAS
jgi:hypothetical protein